VSLSDIQRPIAGALEEVVEALREADAAPGA